MRLQQLLRCSLIILVSWVLASWSVVNAASFDGIIHFSQRATLSVPVSGVIKTVNVSAGQRVSAGDVLLLLDQTRLTAITIRAEADVKIQTANTSELTRDLAHAQELYDRAVLSNVELENAQLKFNRSAAGLEAAQANLLLAKYDLEHSVIAAPFDAWVLTVRANEGENVLNRMRLMPLVIVAAVGKYTVRIFVPLNVRRKLDIGNLGRITIDDRKHNGKIVSASFESVVSNGTKKTVYQVDIAFETDVLYYSGQSAGVTIP